MKRILTILLLTLSKLIIPCQDNTYKKINHMEIVRHPNSLRFYHKGFPVGLIHFEIYDKSTKETVEKAYEIQLPEPKNSAIFVHNLFIPPHARKFGLIKLIFSSAALEFLNENIKEAYWVASPYENKASERRKLKANFQARLQHLINIYQTFGAHLLFQNKECAGFKFCLSNVNRNLLNSMQMKVASKL